ncbi:MAG: hypothetical protein ACI9DF_003329 [Verrucomicrobiales bacterium]|jgi:hypothetical protein
MVFHKTLLRKVTLTVCALLSILAGLVQSAESVIPGFRFVPSGFAELARVKFDYDKISVHQDGQMKPNVVERKLIFSGDENGVFELEIIVGSQSSTGKEFYDARRALVGLLPSNSIGLGEEGCADGSMCIFYRANVFVKGVNVRGTGVFAENLAREIDAQLEKRALVSPAEFNSARPALKQLRCTETELGGNGALRTRLTLESDNPSEESLTVIGVDKLSKHLTFHYVDESELWAHFVPNPPKDLPESGMKTTKAYINVINESMLASQIASDVLLLDFITKRELPIPPEVLSKRIQRSRLPGRLSRDDLQALVEERKRRNLSNEEFSNLIRQKEHLKNEANENRVIVK